MSEYELLDIALSFQNASVNHVMNFVAVFSAYLVVAYLVGDKLSQIQLWIINTTYSLFSLGAASLAYAQQNRFFYYLQEVHERFPQKSEVMGTGVPAPETAFATLILVVLAYIASLLFMYEKRKTQKPN